jgi:hypothetical protein
MVNKVFRLYYIKVMNSGLMYTFSRGLIITVQKKTGAHKQMHKQMGKTDKTSHTSPLMTWKQHTPEQPYYRSIIQQNYARNDNDDQ